MKIKKFGRAAAHPSKSRSEDVVVLDDLSVWLKRAADEVFSVTHDVGPKLAKRILDLNDHNRPLRVRGSKRSVEAYAEAMCKGEWLLNGEAVIVSREGQLNDGQHRLSAIVLSGATVPMTLTFGVDRDSRHTVDQGAARTPGNILSMYGEKSTNVLATAIAFVWSYDGRHPAGSYPSPEEMMHTLDQNPGIRDYINAVRPVTRQFRLSHGYLVGAAFVCARVNGSVCDAFLHSLATGIGIDTDRDPVFVLRKKFISHLTQARRSENILSLEQAALFVKTFNAFRKGRVVTSLRWPNVEGEAFPRAS